MKIYKNLLQKYRDVRFTLEHPGRGGTITYFKYPKEEGFIGRRVLNLGCGNTVYPSPNVVNIDAFKVPGVNVVHDLNKMPLPFKDNEFDLIIANHILEHLPNWWECFKELARIIKVGGTIEVWIPGDGCSSQLGYRDHVNTLNICSFAGIRGTRRNFANAWEQLELQKLGPIKDVLNKYQFFKMAHFWWIAILPDIIQMWMANHLRNVVSEQGFVFVKLKPEGEKSNVN